MNTSVLQVNYSSQLTPDIIDYLNNSLSKSSIAILRELYKAPQMQQKTLAANIHTSVTSLCNILSRMEGIQPQLLVAERVGRAKYYSLTEIANLYVAQIIIPQTEQTGKIHKFSTLFQENTLIAETLHAFYHFRETAGPEWDFILDNTLFSLQQNSRGDQLPTETEELFTLCLNFLNHMKQVKAVNQAATLREIYDILGQPVLIKRLEKYLSAELRDFYALKPLFELEHQNYAKAIQIIDQIFIELDPAVPKPQHADDLCNSILPPEQYMQVFHQICIMRKDFSDNMTPEYKQRVLQHWDTLYPIQSHCLPYIADKCQVSNRNPVSGIKNIL